MLPQTLPLTPADHLSRRLDEFQPKIDWNIPDFSRLFSLSSCSGETIDYRLFRIAEISEGKPKAYRLAMSNVLSCLKNSGCATIYLLSGQPDGTVDFYIGVASHGLDAANISMVGNMLQAAFRGNFLGAQLDVLHSDNAHLDQVFAQSKHFGLITGVPSLNEEGEASEEDFQGVERLVNSLAGESWQLVLVAEAASDEAIQATLSRVYDLSTLLSEHIKHSVQQSKNIGTQTTITKGDSKSLTKGTSDTRTEGTNKGTSDSRSKNRGTSTNETDGTSGSSWSTSSQKGTSTGTSESWSTNSGSSKSQARGTSDSFTTGTSDSRAEGMSDGSSLALTRERTDKRFEEMQKHLAETLIDRLLRGRAKGLYRTALYVSAATKGAYERLSQGVLSTFQGNRSNFTPLRAHPLPEGRPFRLTDLLKIHAVPANLPVPLDAALAHSVPMDENGTLFSATWLNITELAQLAGLPAQELPGFKIRKSVDFGLNPGDKSDKANGLLLQLGHVVQHGGKLKTTVDLPQKFLDKHVFVTGVTGAGKTTTCMKLLLDSGLPFLVIEPAKTEYRALYGQVDDIEYYTLGREDLTPFRLNPFELVSKKQQIASHIAAINATLAAAYPMEAAMPYIVEEAIIKAYASRGWDVHNNENLEIEDPWQNDSDAWPTFDNMIHELDGVIKSKGMGKEFEEKYQGSLVARFTNLTLGGKGRMLNTRHSIDFSTLLDKKVVIELEEIKDEQDKALFMGLIITRLAECMKQRHYQTPGFRHLTLIEEAHRLLSRIEPGDAGSKKMGVDLFANLLAEVRKYGEGLIIADQIPNKLVADVIKNTNTKIVHRLYAADDRNTIGDAMGLSDEQKDFLPLLQPGETVMYCGGWHAPVRVQIEQGTHTDNMEISEEDIRLRGQHQLWAQRERLLPRLAAHPVMDSAERLAGFFADVRPMLTMLLDMARLPKNDSRRKKIYGRFLQKLTPWHDLGEKALGELITRALADCCAWHDANESTRRPWESYLPIALQQLFVSLTGFDEWIEKEWESDEQLQSDLIFEYLRGKTGI